MKMLTLSIANNPEFRSKLWKSLTAHIKKVHFANNDASSVDKQAHIGAIRATSVPHFAKIQPIDNESVSLSGDISIEIDFMARIYGADGEDESIDTSNYRVIFTIVVHGPSRSANSSKIDYSKYRLVVSQCTMSGI